MLYSLTKPFAKIALAIYFRKIYLSNREVLPKDKPVILAANHPTAFIEPCILSCWLDRPLSFLARGDIYLNNFFVRKLYDWYRLIPVFRIDDAGYGHLKSNYDSFERCFQALSRNRVIMILAEGRTKHEKRLRPIMKGTARIVFGTLEKHGDLDIHVVPVGVNYTDSNHFRREVMIDFGEPIKASEYTGIYRENPARAINLITDEISKRLAEKVIHIENPADDDLVERLMELKRSERVEKVIPAYSPDRRPLEEEKSIANKVNSLPDPAKEALKKRVDAYFSSLKKLGITDRGLMDHVSYSVSSAVFLGIGWVPYLTGYVLNFLPLKFGDWLSRKLAKTIEFRASLSVVFSAFAYLFYWFLWLLAALIVRQTWLFAMLAIVPLSGYFAVIYRDIDKRWKACKQVSFLEDEQVEELVKMREGLTGF
jgi:glycerol-3-phosphate O-acyltransferase / dihydroxyacetone phosphate acyltransferase